ncbi:3-coathanger stack domain-containing protein [Candidatus Uabimicrobium amorphum]|uniref:Rhodanese domain-containing protein n=2 Tax=Uabimicrobium amorphum TaxID=2596890 RepID=A0A5S9F6I1_UABAM|nr:hypothetical protein UABAM_04678 [Candidatus Uabimicrobium amorphum]
MKKFILFTCFILTSFVCTQTLVLTQEEYTGLGDHRRMNTHISLYNNGLLKAKTRVWTAKKLKGFTGGVNILFFNDSKQLIHQTPLKKYGVDGTGVPFTKSDVTKNWSTLIPINVLNDTSYIVIYQRHTPTPRFLGHSIKDIEKKIGKTLYELQVKKRNTLMSLGSWAQEELDNGFSYIDRTYDRLEKGAKAELKRGGKYLMARYKALEGFVKTGKIDLKQEWRNGIDFLARRGKDLKRSVETEINNGVKYVKRSWLYKRLQVGLRHLFMEKVHFAYKATKDSRGNTLTGEPVYYVNGIYTTLNPEYEDSPISSAKEEADLLANKLRRPVWVIYNPSVVNPPKYHTGTPKVGEDIGEFVYDRIWPTGVADALHVPHASILHPQEIKERFSSLTRLQNNPTTRQIAYLLYHAKGPISIISYSQGCVITRNACFTLTLFGKSSWMRHHLAWVALGSPLGETEMQIVGDGTRMTYPAKFTSPSNDEDLFANLVAGMDYFTIGGIEDHALYNYLDTFDESDLWPTNNVSLQLASSYVIESEEQVFQSKKIEAKSVIKKGTTTVLEAQEVLLLPGFAAEDGSVVHIKFIE